MSSVAETIEPIMQAAIAQASTSARSLLGPAFNIQGYGAKGDGYTDDTTPIQLAINDAIAAGGGYVYIPLGVYAISQVLGVSGPVVLGGVGSGGITPSPFTGGTVAPSASPSRLLWTGAAGGTMLQTTASSGFGGSGIRNLGLDGNGSAAYGAILDSMVNSHFSDLAIHNCTTQGLWLKSTYNDCAFCDFQHLQMFGNLAGVLLDGTSVFDVCHCLFSDLVCGVKGTGAMGIWCKVSDNISFLRTYLMAESGSTGWGVQLGNTEGDGYTNNSHYFWHLEPSSLGMNVLTGSVSNLVIAYDVSNGQPQPTVQSDAILVWTTMSLTDTDTSGITIYPAITSGGAMNIPNGSPLNMGGASSVVDTDDKLAFTAGSGGLFFQNNAKTVTTFSQDTDGNTLVAGTLSAKPGLTTLAGATAGSIAWVQDEQGTVKRVLGYLNGYENATDVAQVIGFPIGFSYAPEIITQPSGFGATVAVDALTLPASMDAPVTGCIIVMGL